MDVHTDDGGDGSLHRLVHVARIECRLQPLLRLPRLHEDDAHGAHVGRGWSHLRQVVDLLEQCVLHGLVQPDAVRPGFAENEVQIFAAQHVAHVDPLLEIRRVDPGGAYRALIETFAQPYAGPLRISTPRTTGLTDGVYCPTPRKLYQGKELLMLQADAQAARPLRVPEAADLKTRIRVSGVPLGVP